MRTPREFWRDYRKHVINDAHIKGLDELPEKLRALLVERRQRHAEITGHPTQGEEKQRDFLPEIIATAQSAGFSDLGALGRICRELDEAFFEKGGAPKGRTGSRAEHLKAVRDHAYSFERRDLEEFVAKIDRLPKAVANRLHGLCIGRMKDEDTYYCVSGILEALGESKYQGMHSLKELLKELNYGHYSQTKPVSQSYDVSWM